MFLILCTLVYVRQWLCTYHATIASHKGFSKPLHELSSTQSTHTHRLHTHKPVWADRKYEPTTNRPHSVCASLHTSIQCPVAQHVRVRTANYTDDVHTARHQLVIGSIPSSRPRLLTASHPPSLIRWGGSEANTHSLVNGNSFALYGRDCTLHAIWRLDEAAELTLFAVSLWPIAF